MRRKEITRTRAKLIALLTGILLVSAAQAEITVDVSVSSTGPPASLGIPEKNTIALLPNTLAGEKPGYTVLDDATGPTTAAKYTRRFVSEDKVGLMLGLTTTPTSRAMAEVAAERKTVLVAMAPPAPMDASSYGWVYQTPQNVGIMATAIVDHMAAAGASTASFIGYADAYGEV